MSETLALGMDICTDLAGALRREWLVTNGRGAFACGTVAGAQTRRYHGLLIAARRPPVGRTALLIDLDVRAEVEGLEYALACHEFADGTIEPSGHRFIESFTLEGTVPTWRYALGPARLIRRVYMARGLNASYVTLALERSTGPVRLRVRPLCSGRDYHWQRRGGEGYASQALPGGCRVEVGNGIEPLRITASIGEFHHAPDIWWNLLHRAEAARGLDAVEDLFSPGEFDIILEPGRQVAFTATTDSDVPDADIALDGLRRHEAALLACAPAAAPGWIRRLTLAADQFIATRSDGVGEDGQTVIAGYPWFSDWGRDTMIALPGLTLATGRAPVAARILRTFARHVDQGMLPNRFPDDGEGAEYNTVDATLWYFMAVRSYLRQTGDRALARDLFPVLHDIIEWHRRGTRHGIRLDSGDGLLRAGEPGVQLTWMDAKVGDWVVTPRIGKPVEINALWCNALAFMAELAESIGEGTQAAQFRRSADATAAAFAAKFWNPAAGYLNDVIDTPHGAVDDSLRPNQLIALSLPRMPIDADRARQALAACERVLLTPLGLRTLAPGSADYAPHYAGGPVQRDAAYHQGTVWPWLLGAFVRAHFALYGDAERALSYLAPLAAHLADAGLGQVSEVLDAEAPYLPGGCFAQAWSVSEPLACWATIFPLIGSRT